MTQKPEPRYDDPRGVRIRAATRSGLIVFVLLAFSACASFDVQTDWNPQYDFGRLQTFRWADRPQTMTGDTTVDTNGLLAQRVMQAVDANLSAKGYTKTATSQADFEVAWFLTIEPKTQVSTVNNYYGYGPGIGWGGYGGYGGGSTTTMVDSYNEGTLIIDLRDPAGQLLWRGSASARLREKVDPQKAQQRVDDAVGQILAKFPPPTS